LFHASCAGLFIFGTACDVFDAQVCRKGLTHQMRPIKRDVPKETNQKRPIKKDIKKDIKRHILFQISGAGLFILGTACDVFDAQVRQMRLKNSKRDLSKKTYQKRPIKRDLSRDTYGFRQLAKTCLCS